MAAEYSADNPLQLGRLPDSGGIDSKASPAEMLAAAFCLEDAITLTPARRQSPPAAAAARWPGTGDAIASIR